MHTPCGSRRNVVTQAIQGTGRTTRLPISLLDGLGTLVAAKSERRVRPRWTAMSSTGPHSHK
jgi:hypothetical protein